MPFFVAFSQFFIHIAIVRTALLSCPTIFLDSYAIGKVGLSKCFVTFQGLLSFSR
jgi:hypothetical protein